MNIHPSARTRLPPLHPPPPVVRYEWKRPGELLHLDVKKLAKVRAVGHRITGVRGHQNRGLGWEYVHVCIDDCTRLAYVEVLHDEKGSPRRPSCAALWPGTWSGVSGSAG